MKIQFEAKNGEIYWYEETGIDINRLVVKLFTERAAPIIKTKK